MLTKKKSQNKNRKGKKKTLSLRKKNYCTKFKERPSWFIEFGRKFGDYSVTSCLRQPGRWRGGIPRQSPGSVGHVEAKFDLSRAYILDASIWDLSISDN